MKEEEKEEREIMKEEEDQSSGKIHSEFHSMKRTHRRRTRRRKEQSQILPSYSPLTSITVSFHNKRNKIAVYIYIIYMCMLRRVGNVCVLFLQEAVK